MIAAAYSATTGGQAGPIGLAVIVVLGIVVAFLGRSMNKHLAKVPKSFDKPAKDNPTDDQQTAKNAAESGSAETGPDSPDK